MCTGEQCARSTRVGNVRMGNVLGGYRAIVKLVRIMVTKSLWGLFWSCKVGSEAKMNSQDIALPWRHNEREGASIHRHDDCLLNSLFMCRSKKTWKLSVTGFCAGKSPVTGEFPAQRASNAVMFPFDYVIMVHVRYDACISVTN